LAAALLCIIAAYCGCQNTTPDTLISKPGYSFDSAPGRLPKSVVPTRYAVELRPDLDKRLLPGSETVEIDVREATDRIVLNALEVTVETAELDGNRSARIAADPKSETVTLTFAQPIAVGPHRLRLAFSGRINPFSRGMYYADYPTAAGRKRMIGTQLEPADARRLFPSWDEPAFKAVFEISVVVPRTFLAVSNMPVAGETPVDGQRKRVTFASTPKMSSYLVVVCAGELERITADVAGVTVGVVTTVGKSAQGRTALDDARRLLSYYNDYFGIPYPLPKLDLIAVPGGFGGAMENWGGITFFESRLLFDPATSPPAARRGIMFIIAHEMAHLWFGDLVTTAWWDDLWLNEGFATWMQAKASDRLQPEWEVWLNSGGKRAAMSDDAKRTSHPIQQPVADESEAMSAFDSITYRKGEALIRMIEAFVGEDVFRAGIRRYMRDHAFSNATTTDLWRALDAASGKPVSAIAAGFTEQPGVPLVMSEATCRGNRQHLRLTQSRYTVRDPGAAPLRWQVPVTLGSVGAASVAGTTAVRSLLLNGATEVDTGACDDPIKLNVAGTGYYRVEYDPATHAALFAAMPRLSPADQVDLLDDVWALAVAGRLGAETAFAAFEHIPADGKRAVWEYVIGVLDRVDFLERGRPGRDAFRAYARARLRPVFERLGWQPKPGESEDDLILRSRLIGVLGGFDDPEILAEARRRFAQFLRSPQSLPGSLRGPVIHLAGRTADRHTYETLHRLARTTTSTEDRVRYYGALAAARNPALARRTLAIAISNEVPASLAGRLIFGVAGAGEQPQLAWTFVQKNLAVLIERQGANFQDYVAGALLSNFTDPARATELENFAPSHVTAGGRISSARAAETILANAEFCSRELPGLDRWIGGRLAPQ